MVLPGLACGAREALVAKAEALREQGHHHGSRELAQLASTFLVELMASAVDGDGSVNLEALEKTASRDIAALVARLAVAAERAPPAHNPLSSSSSTSLSSPTLKALGRSVDLGAIAARMPALDAVVAHHAHGAPLARFDGGLVLQHLMMPACAGIEALSSLGLPRDGLGVLGKSYSTKDAAFAWLSARGYDVADASRANDNVTEDAKARLATVAKAQLQALFKDVSATELNDPQAPRRFLIVDEGGVYLRALHEDPALAVYGKLCVAVEHTENGMQVLDELAERGLPLTMPVVAMARCALKKEVEAIAIGENIVDEAERMIAELPAQVRPGGPRKNAALIGYGDVGRHVADSLRRRGYDVTAIDAKGDARTRAKSAGHVAVDANDPAAKAAALRRADVVVSVTGKKVLDVDDYESHLKDGAIAYVGGSGNHELGVGAMDGDALARATRHEHLGDDGQAEVEFRGHTLRSGDYFAPAKNRHLVFVTPQTKKEILVLYGGGVVNMRRGLPPEYSQLVRALVTASAVEASRLAATGAAPGRYDVPVADQDRIRAAVDAALRAAGHGQLSAPDFRAIASW